MTVNWKKESWRKLNIRQQPMYEDLKSNNLTEIEVINGAVSKLGKQMKVKTPINDIITTCLQLHNQKISIIKR